MAYRISMLLRKARAKCVVSAMRRCVVLWRVRLFVSSISALGGFVLRLSTDCIVQRMSHIPV